MTTSRQPLKLPKLAYEPKTQLQRRCREEWPQCKLIFLFGEAGSGKTTTALAEAWGDLLTGKSRHVTFCRPTVATDENIGFEPGDLLAKLVNWQGAFFDCFEGLSDDSLNALLAHPRTPIRVWPAGRFKGRTIRGGTLIVDEAEDLTLAQLKVIATRPGAGGRVVLCGDPQQTDNPDAYGLRKFAALFRGDPEVAIIEASADDMNLRDPFVQRAVERLKAVEEVKVKRGKR
jgi:phosphate starvation-inducible PhoH-like protein